jgi:hypothetical protein
MGWEPTLRRNRDDRLDFGRSKSLEESRFQLDYRFQILRGRQIDPPFISRLRFGLYKRPRFVIVNANADGSKLSGTTVAEASGRPVSLSFIL